MQEILEKSSQNIESAQKVIYEMKVAEKQSDKDFVNLHSTNRKRKFRDLQNSTLTSGKNSEISNQNSFTQNNNVNENEKNFFIQDSGRKILSIKSFKNNSNYSQNSYLSDEQLEKLINEVSVLSSREEIKTYLRTKISNMITQSKKFLI